MCGRFAFFQEIDPLIDDLDAVDLTDPRLRQRWNVPPTAPIYVVTESVDGDTGEVLRALRVARWGLLPPFAKDLAFSSRTFNARRETLAQKPSFRGSLARYRAIVPMAGYYEWQRDPSGSSTKQPYFITPKDGSPLLMAALVSWWKGDGTNDGPAATDDGAWLLTATIITREAAGDLARIHDRTPVMLRRSEVDAWLDPGMDDKDAAEAWVKDDAHLLDDGALEVRPVDPAVGSVRNEGPELIAEAPRLL
ncbi:MAG: SOS response-associated peptidase [Brachybacterium sp.]|nr:SOS response-associated peptidase [Brachybacterium sp.]